jgi:hypothetical protein
MLKDDFEPAEHGVCVGNEPSPPTLQDVFDAVDALDTLKPTRKRDMLSALRRFAKLTDRSLADCSLDMKEIRKDLADMTSGPGAVRRMRISLCLPIRGSGGRASQSTPIFSMT